jgi:hypothetical protein
MYKPASEVVFEAFKQAVDELKNQGLANSNHVIDLARGASVLRSSHNISRQSRHTDFETSACRHRLELPGSMFIFTQVLRLLILFYLFIFKCDT